MNFALCIISQDESKQDESLYEGVLGYISLVSLTGGPKYIVLKSYESPSDLPSPWCYRLVTFLPTTGEKNYLITESLLTAFSSFPTEKNYYFLFLQLKFTFMLIKPCIKCYQTILMNEIWIHFCTI